MRSSGADPWGKSKMHKHDDAKPSPATSPASYFILYYAEPTGSGGVMGPMKRARYATIPEAVERAKQMKRVGDLIPIEIRDPKDGLITCELMGWRMPSLVAQQPVDYTSRYKVAG
ncbi:MAG TPA: hypothetical protein VFF19_06115 [Reyranella sp.]|nr:hypothetical protein [Reyranella sp.]